MADATSRISLRDRFAAAAQEFSRGVREAASVERWLGPTVVPGDSYLRLVLGVRAATVAFSSADHPEQIRQDRFPRK